MSNMKPKDFTPRFRIRAVVRHGTWRALFAEVSDGRYVNKEQHWQRIGDECLSTNECLREIYQYHARMHETQETVMEHDEIMKRLKLDTKG